MATPNVDQGASPVSTDHNLGPINYLGDSAGDIIQDA
jgi:hypothetical protein